MNKNNEPKTTHPLYPLYQNMMGRCYNPKNPSYKHYGARGIKVCDEWQTFKGFWEWSNEHPRPDGTTLDRKDVNGDYSPLNCTWSNSKEQGRNKTNTVMYTYQGITKPLAEWAEIKGINESVLFSRIKLGWGEERIFEKVETRNMTTAETAEEICKEIELGHKYKEIAKRLNVNVSVVSRIAHGETFKEISSKYNFLKKNKGLTGKDAWALIAPLIAPHGGIDNNGKISLLDEAYILVFSALNYWDENHKS